MKVIDSIRINIEDEHIKKVKGNARFNRHYNSAKFAQGKYHFFAHHGIGQQMAKDNNYDRQHLMKILSDDINKLTNVDEGILQKAKISNQLNKEKSKDINKIITEFKHLNLSGKYAEESSEKNLTQIERIHSGY